MYILHWNDCCNYQYLKVQWIANRWDRKRKVGRVICPMVTQRSCGRAGIDINIVPMPIYTSSYGLTEMLEFCPSLAHPTYPPLQEITMELNFKITDILH